jgi:methanethiol S-methyltransferase
MDTTDGLSTFQIAALAAGWAAYGATHSLLASNTVKRAVALHWRDATRGYRLLFNTIAAILLLPLLWLTQVWRTAPLWQWAGAWGWTANGLALAAFAAFLWSCRHYDLGEFSGLAQWRAGGARPEDCGPLRISPLHRYVRHPWYFLALVILWTRDMDEARLVSTACVSIYFWIGSRFEERKLIACHGRAYERYRQRVAGLVPLPWRCLNASEARKLCNAAPASRPASFPEESGGV